MSQNEITYASYLEELAGSSKGFGATLRPSEFTSAYRYYDSSSGIGVRPEFTRDHYNWFRPNSWIPTGRNEHELHLIMDMCSKVYERVGIVRSVVDMMADFAIEGVEIVHPDNKPQEFWKAWSDKINLKDRAEKFLIWFYKSGNVVVRRRFMTLDKKVIKKFITIDDVDDLPNVVKIPLHYIFYNPSTVHATGGELSPYAIEKQYSIKVGPVYSPLSNKFEEKIYDQLNKETKESIERKNTIDRNYVPIPSDKVYVAHYKKDDTEIWAKSFIYSILDDVIYNDKLKLAKMSTLDNMVSITRLWKLGDHKESIFPTNAAGSKLADILQNNTGGGPIDIIWGSDIELEEFYPPIDKLVNFTENYHSILLGLGVPEILVGGSESKSSAATNSLGLKNIIKRLEAGRNALVGWLNAEIDIIMKEMNFRKRPVIRFSNADLYDERTYFNLLVQLVDRNIISDKRLLEIINEIPELELSNVQKEQEYRENGKKPEKASPYHNPQLTQVQEFQYMMNLENESKKIGEEPKEPGRPPGSKDSFQRKRNTADISTYAFSIMPVIEKLVNDIMLQNYNKSNARQLTADEKTEIEKIQFDLLSKLEPGTIITCDKLLELSQIKPCSKILSSMTEYFGELISEHDTNKIITYEDRKIYRILAYIHAWSMQ